MITEDYVSFEIAKLLKEKGFEDKCDYIYKNKSLQFDDTTYYYGGVKLIDRRDNEEIIPAPSQSLALKWLREVHKINIVIGVASDDDNLYSLWKFDIWNGNYSIIWGDKREKFNSYEEAVEAAIEYTLKNLIRYDHKTTTKNRT